MFAKDFKTTPYWWDEAPLDESAATELPDEVDVLIVGAGYTGLHTLINLGLVVARAMAAKYQPQLNITTQRLPNVLAMHLHTTSWQWVRPR